MRVSCTERAPMLPLAVMSVRGMYVMPLMSLFVVPITMVMECGSGSGVPLHFECQIVPSSPSSTFAGTEFALAVSALVAVAVQPARDSGVCA